VQSFNDIFVWDCVSDELECDGYAGLVVLGRSWVDGVALDGGVGWSGAVVCAATTLAANNAINTKLPVARFMAVLHYLAKNQSIARISRPGRRIDPVTPANTGRSAPTAARLI
jgi:hypothetical protein